LVSIILPTYNRSRFLSAAFQSIKNQLHQNWELIIVDDGSSDDSEEVVKLFQHTESRSVTYIKQINQGPAVARNTGIKVAKGQYVAFYDSDDIWLPHHLKNCVGVMVKYSNVDWVYGACQRRLQSDNSVLLESTFYTNGKPNSLFSLTSKVVENLHIIEDRRATEFQIKYGIDSGLQNSVMRRNIFSDMLLPEFRIGEDRLFIAMALKRNYTLAFLDDIHVYYMVHDDNISDTNLGEANLNKRIEVMRCVIESYEKTPEYIKNLTRSEKKSLSSRLADDYFWKLGYSLLWQKNYRSEAIEAFKKGLHFQPFNLIFWKSYLKALVVFKLTKQ
jgi:glycosyltransferase involved in cell wall biosynthesis